MNQSHRRTGFIRKSLILGCMSMLCLVSAQADVVIYKHFITVTQHGQQSLLKTNYTGWTFINFATAEFGLVKVFGNTFHVQQPEANRASFLGVTGQTKSFGVIAIQEFDFAGLTAKGISQHIKIGTNLVNNSWNIPRTLAVSGTQLMEPQGGGFFPIPWQPIPFQSFNAPPPSSASQVFRNFKGSLVFDRANTLFANSQQLDTEEVILHFTNLLLAKGYQNLEQQVENPNGPANPTAPTLP